MFVHPVPCLTYVCSCIKNKPNFLLVSVKMIYTPRLIGRGRGAWGAHASPTYSTGQKDPQKMDFKKYFSSLNQSQLSLLTEFHVPTRYSPMARQSAHTARQMMMQERLSFLAYTYPLLCLGQSRHSSFKLRYKCSKRDTYNYSFFNRTVKNEMYCLPS